MKEKKNQAEKGCVGPFSFDESMEISKYGLSQEYCYNEGCRGCGCRFALGVDEVDQTCEGNFTRNNVDVSLISIIPNLVATDGVYPP